MAGEALEGPVYVLADDGLWYTNPAVSGSNWSLTFDAPEGVVLEMWATRRKSPRQPEAVAAFLMSNAKIACTLTLIRHRIEANGVRRWWYRLTLFGPPPATLMRQGHGRWQPGRDGSILDFGRVWG